MNSVHWKKMDDWLSGYIDHSHQADQTTLDSKHIDHSRPRLRLRLGNRNRSELRTWTPTTLLEATFWWIFLINYNLVIQLSWDYTLKHTIPFVSTNKLRIWSTNCKRWEFQVTLNNGLEGNLKLKVILIQRIVQNLHHLPHHRLVWFNCSWFCGIDIKWGLQWSIIKSPENCFQF